MYKILSILVILSACSTGSFISSDLTHRLTNRGPVALSSENPYIASNLFVAEQSAESEVIAGFVKYRGTPSAVEISKGYLSLPQIFYYYLDKRELYTLEKLSNTWIVSGPERILDDKFAKIQELSVSSGSKAILNTIGKDLVEIAKPSINSNSSTASFGAHNTNAKIPVIRNTTKPITMQSTAMPITTMPTQTDSVQSKVLELQASSSENMAEITPKGDLVHYVTYPGENLSIIARWYTHDRNNTERLARINRLTDPNRMEIGDVVVVPSYLLKSKVLLTKPALDVLISEMR